uniref:Uncharacterized protein n=1 Tax=Rhizophora mucronata TaxID=61149 RepID=A0A2P2PC78_RHIMU
MRFSIVIPMPLKVQRLSICSKLSFQISILTPLFFSFRFLFYRFC